MERREQALEPAQSFRPLRAALIAVGSIALVLAVSWIVRTYPNPGYQAGYAAAVAEARQANRTGLDPAVMCDQIYDRNELSPSVPRYDYTTFIQGCRDGVDHLHGAHAPAAPGDRPPR